MSASKEITVAYLRTKESMKEYINVFQDRKKNSLKINPFLRSLETGEDYIIGFKHWFIMSNSYPYDAIATINHMLCTRRSIPFIWSELNQDERDELETLKLGYIKEHYDVVLENLPSGQTQSGHFHLHLLKLKRTSLEDFFKDQK